MNYKAILFYLGLFAFPLSGLAFLNILYSTYFDYFLSIDSYTVTFFLALITGTLFCYYGKNSVKKISIDLKEKKAKKRTQNEVFENKIEDKNLAEKTFKEISPKIVNHLTRNTEKKITETNINLKNTNNGKIKFSE